MSDNKMNDLLNLGASCDLFTPLYAILRDAAAGDVTHFGVYAYGGFDRGAIRRLLSTSGIESWGYIYNVAGDLIMFSVKEEQAKQAAEVLEREGVPVLGGTTSETTEAAKPAAALSNNVAMQPMEIVPAPSVWGLLKRLFR